uniref:Uncharacterized protein n=1 Tax=Globodera rostochiensis TaxID=31243 RepID=A0A914I9V3_GLORO
MQTSAFFQLFTCQRLANLDVLQLYFDRSVIEFFQRLGRLFDSNGINICFGTEADQSRSWETICHQLWPLINDNIYGLYLFDSDLECLRQYSSTVLDDCAKLRLVYAMDLFPEFPADDSAGASSAQALAKWLHNPRGDSRPKVFIYAGRSMPLEALKSQFRNSSKKTANFITHWGRSSEEIVPFDLKNNLTSERLELRHLNKDKVILVRCPIKRDEVKWAKWEKEATDFDWGRQWNRIHIDLKDMAAEESSDDDEDEAA